MHPGQISVRHCSQCWRSWAESIKTTRQSPLPRWTSQQMTFSWCTWTGTPSSGSSPSTLNKWGALGTYIPGNIVMLLSWTQCLLISSSAFYQISFILGSSPPYPLMFNLKRALHELPPKSQDLQNGVPLGSAALLWPSHYCQEDVVPSDIGTELYPEYLE